MEVKRGELYMENLSPGIGSEQGGESCVNPKKRYWK